ncbi:hypothetical protein [Streptomyces sp. NPDC096323]|uniref:hypothetical protein n=1 Tax=Streptomyces sp. NPDC096323 TaxID=3155822 RepID=UPI00331E5A82
MEKNSKFRRLARPIAVGAAALSLVLVASNPASAKDMVADCGTTGAVADVTIYDFNGATDRIDFHMEIKDSLADGHHARARLLTKTSSGAVVYWKWHSDTNGSGNGWVTLNSYAIDDRGIFDVGIQVARFEGDTLLNSCKAWMYKG